MPGYEWQFDGESMRFTTEDGLFSPAHMDEGSVAMLRHASLSPGACVLDLGCGCGCVGVFCARKCGAENVWMTDIDPRAIETARKNAAANGVAEAHVALSDGFHALDEAGFDLILSNPPYHTDFAVAKHFIEKGFNRLKIGGTLLMVTKRREWYLNKLISVFGGARVYEENGYFVFEAQRRGASYAKAKKK